MDPADRIPGTELRPLLAPNFHRQHLSATSRILASVAHNVRSSVASVLYSADFLDARGGDVREELLRESVSDIAEACRRLQLTVDSLLECAQLGPAISIPVDLRDVLNGSTGLMRALLHSALRELKIDAEEATQWVRGNPILIGQIFVNLVVTAAECSPSHGLVEIRARDSSAQGPSGFVHIRVAGDRAALSRQLAERGAAPDSCARLALADAQAAAEAQGGRLLLECDTAGMGFLLLLPRSSGPR